MAEIHEVAALALAVSEVIEDDIPLESNEDELEGLALLFLETERIPASRITGYAEDVVPNMTATCLSEVFARAGKLFTGFLIISRVYRSWYQIILGTEEDPQFHWRKNCC